jgi:hypothetical protein
MEGFAISKANLKVDNNNISITRDNTDTSIIEQLIRQEEVITSNLLDRNAEDTDLPVRKAEDTICETHRKKPKVVQTERINILAGGGG